MAAAVATIAPTSSSVSNASTKLLKILSGKSKQGRSAYGSVRRRRNNGLSTTTTRTDLIGTLQCTPPSFIGTTIQIKLKQRARAGRSFKLPPFPLACPRRGEGFSTGLSTKITASTIIGTFSNTCGLWWPCLPEMASLSFAL